MNFLIISKYFYPQNRIASFRINAFAKYIRNAGHSVTVIAEVIMTWILNGTVAK